MRQAPLAGGHKPSKYSHPQWIEVVVGGWSKDLAPELPPPGGCWRSLLKQHPGKSGTAPYVDAVRAWLEGDERLKHLAFWDSTTKLGLPRKESADWKAFLRETVVPRFNGGTPDAEATHALDQPLPTERDILEILELLHAASTPEGDDTRSRKRRHDETELPLAAQPGEQVPPDLPAAAATTGGVEDDEERARPAVVEGGALPVVARPFGFVNQYLKMLSTLHDMIETHLATTAGLPDDEKGDLKAQADELGARLAAHGEGKFSHYRGELTLRAPRAGSLAARVSRILARMSDEDKRSTSPPALAHTSVICCEAAAPTYRTLPL
jgi:hypothetical protein